MKPSPPNLTPGTINLINQIKEEEVQELLLKGLHPSEVVEGWYYTLACGILRIQRGGE